MLGDAPLFGLRFETVHLRTLPMVRRSGPPWPRANTDARRARLAALAGLLALAGCAVQQPPPNASRSPPPAHGPNPAEARAALQRRIEVCRSRFPAGTPHFLDKARCDETARRATLLASGMSAGLVDAYLARRTDVAGRLDRGEITRERAQHDLDAAADQANAAERAQRRETAPAPAADPGTVASALAPDPHPLPPPVPVRPSAPP